jgi:DNA polymerase-3 subunit gamma/tau
MSLYRKYRPQGFNDVTAQESVVTTLRNAVQQDKIAHAYLFAGPRGTGKTSLARILAKELLTKGITDDVVRNHVIKGVEDGSLVDLIEIDAASNRGIDDIRDLVEKIQFSPVSAAAKVYIIDEVHMLTREAFNALLKTLEEPPAYAYFILATTEMQKIPATIQSRCQRFLFKQINANDIATRLRYIAEQEGISADDAALISIASSAQGGMRDAISLLDQLRSLPHISKIDVEARTGSLGHEHVAAMLHALDTHDRQQIVESIRNAEENGMSMETAARQLLSALRERLHTHIRSNTSIEETSNHIEAILRAVRNIRISPVPALDLEAALLSQLQDTASQKAHVAAPGITQSPAPVVPSHTASGATATTIEKSHTPPPTQSPTLATQPQANNTHSVKKNPNPDSSPSTGVSLESIRAIWPSIVDKATPAAVKMSLKNGHVTALHGNTLVITFTSGFHRDRVAQTDASTMIEHLLQTACNERMRVDCVVDQEALPPLTSTPMVDLAEAAADVF